MIFVFSDSAICMWIRRNEVNCDGVGDYTEHDPNMFLAMFSPIFMSGTQG